MKFFDGNRPMRIVSQTVWVGIVSGVADADDDKGWCVVEESIDYKQLHIWPPVYGPVLLRVRVPQP